MLLAGLPTESCSAQDHRLGNGAAHSEVVPLAPINSQDDSQQMATNQPDQDNPLNWDSFLKWC